MKFRPHDYQKYCIARLINEDHLGLMLPMGLGKTVITLTALNELLYHRSKINRILIIAPKRVAESTWQDEAKKWDHLKHLRFSTVLGSEAKRIRALDEDSDIYIINRENIPWLVNYLGKNWFFDTVVIDEFSSFKNSKSKRFRALKKVLPKINRLYGLTGTPASNGFMDLYGQIYLLDRGQRLGKSLTRYRDTYFKAIPLRGLPGVYKYELREGSAERIKNRISDICVSINPGDYIDVPKTVYRKVGIVLTLKSQKQYEHLQQTLFLDLGNTQIDAANFGVLTNKLLQIASGAVYDTQGKPQRIHTEKLEALSEIIEEAGDESVLVFYNYKHERDSILEAFKNAVVLESDTEIRAWNAGKIKLLLAHPASCGYGLNLQAGGHIIVWFSPTWNLEQYSQANARLARQGQDNTVVINHIIARNTMDETVLEALSSKEDTQSSLLKALNAKKEEIVNGSL